jgi:MMPL family
MTIGQTQVSVPLLAKLVSSLQSTLATLDALRRAIFAFLVITLLGSILSAISTFPAMYFPQSRLLIYFNMFWPALATVFAFAAAIFLSTTIALSGVINGYSDTVGVQIRQGVLVLLFVWLSFVFVSLVTLYWASVWFVEARKSSFIKRRRDEDEIGHWRGIGREVWRDVRGRRRKPNMRADI